MTLKEALEENVQIEPGRRVRTFGGWCRRDVVRVGGSVVGGIQTRRSRSGRSEVTTFTGNKCLDGYNVEWLVARAGEL